MESCSAHVIGRNRLQNDTNAPGFRSCLTTQLYNGGTFIELIQPLSGQSISQEYLTVYPTGSTEHMAFRLLMYGFDRITPNDLLEQGYRVISKVEDPIGKMAFF